MKKTKFDKNVQNIPFTPDKRRTSYESHCLNWVRLMQSTAFDVPGTKNL